MSTKDYGCFFCKGKSTKRHGACNTCGAPVDIADDLIGQSLDSYVIKSVIGRGFYGWTVEAADDFQTFAVKVIPAHRIKSTTEPFTEAKAFAECSGHRNIARFFRLFKSTLVVQGRTVDVVCMVFELIQGAVPLRVFLSDDTTRLTRHDVVTITKGIASGLARMHSRHLWHDDLHDDNILIRATDVGDNIDEQFEIKLIDFGSVKAKNLGDENVGVDSDYHYLSKHIYGVIAKYEASHLGRPTPADIAFSKAMKAIARQLADKDVTRDTHDPASIVETLRKSSIDAGHATHMPSFNEMLARVRVSFDDPLDNTNAIHLLPQDVALLFIDKLGWLAQMTKPQTTVVVGPRGCGKTMLLRYLSVTSQAHPRRKESSREAVASRLAGLPYLAFLVTCGELRTPYLRSSYKKLEQLDVARAEDFTREFFNLHFVVEVGRTILWLKEEQLAPIADDELLPLEGALMDMFSIASSTPSRLDTIVEQLERRCAILSNLPDPGAYTPSGFCADDVLVRLARALRAVPWIGDKDVLFLLDDYSVSLLPAFVQKAYNPVVFKLSPDTHLKVSSEGDGPVLEDHLSRKYEEGRELRKVNLGELYLKVSDGQGRKFMEDILQARCKETGKGSLERLKALLGEHPQETQFGQYIMSRGRPGVARFHGFGLICKLCSGDISYIIQLLNELVRGQWDDKYPSVPDHRQDELIKQFANRQLDSLRNIGGFGSRLHEFAVQVGTLLKHYILTSKQKTSVDERLRIEIEGPGTLSEEAQGQHEELLRRSVLIYCGTGKDRKGRPARKFLFRRLLAPCFPFSPVRKGCIPLTVETYQEWLLNPSVIATRMTADGTLWDDHRGEASPEGASDGQ